MQKKLYSAGATDLIEWAASAINQRSPVLDVGCGRGYLAEAASNCEIHGLEPDKERAQDARKSCERVYEQDIDSFLDDHQQKAVFDAVVCIDLLEHLVSPESTLAKMRTILKPQGILVTAIPNVAHISSRIRVAKGEWRYADEGLLDRTHLRFYTYYTAIELVRSSGYEVLSVGTIETFPRLVRPIKSLLRGRWPNLFGRHTLVTARVASNGPESEAVDRQA